MPLHSPAFLFERTTRAADGGIVEYVRSIYRGDRYKLVTELNRRPRDPRDPLTALPGQYQPGSTSVAVESHVPKPDRRGLRDVKRPFIGS